MDKDPISVTSLTADRIPAGVYDVDPAHSSIGFAVKHMGIATVRGAAPELFSADGELTDPRRASAPPTCWSACWSTTGNSRRRSPRR